MKTKIIGFAILAGVFFLLTTLFFVNKNETATVVSAKERYVNHTTPTPFATHVPGVSVQALQKHARSKIVTSSVRGVEMSAANFRVEDNLLMADICLQVPNSNDWSFGDSKIRFGDVEVLAAGGFLLERLNTSPNGEKTLTTFIPKHGVEMKKNYSTDLPSYFCVTIEFRLDNNHVPTRVVLTINRLRSSAHLGEECNYLDAIQSIIDSKGAGIKIDCTHRSDTGSGLMIVEKPGNMNQQAAEKLLADAYNQMFLIEGPWVFQGEVMNAADSAPTEAPVEPLATESPEETVTPTP